MKFVGIADIAIFDIGRDFFVEFLVRIWLYGENGVLLRYDKHKNYAYEKTILFVRGDNVHVFVLSVAI